MSNEMNKLGDNICMTPTCIIHAANLLTTLNTKLGIILRYIILNI